MNNAGICAFILATITASSAFAQGQAAAPQMTPEALYKAAQNQLGIVEYCKDKGFATQEDIDGQKSIMKMMQEPADKSGLEEAQAAGQGPGAVAWSGNRCGRIFQVIGSER